MNKVITTDDIQGITDLMCRVNGFDPEMSATEKSHKTKNWKSDLRKDNWKSVKYLGYVELYFIEKEQLNYKSKIQEEYKEDQIELSDACRKQYQMQDELTEKIYDANRNQQHNESQGLLVLQLQDVVKRFRIFMIEKLTKRVYDTFAWDNWPVKRMHADFGL